VPTYEYYGFTLYLTSSLAFIVYVLWAFLPSPLLHSLGIYYYPNRWWALAIPAWTVMLVVYIYVALASYNVGHLTLKLEDLGCLVDESAQVAVVDEYGKIVRVGGNSWDRGGKARSPERSMARAKSGTRDGVMSRGVSASSSLRRQASREDLDWKALWREGTDAVMDIPVGGVCEILYGGEEADYDDRDDDGNGNLYGDG
jgi:phosphatidylinositol glycan class P protein